MPSLLTRRIFRLIIHNEIHSTRYGWVQPTRRCLHAQRTAGIPTILTRSFFSFSKERQRRAKPVDYDPGYEKMQELSSSLKMGIRAPPDAELVQSFNEFFKAKQRARGWLEDIHAQHALTTFEYLQRQAKHSDEAALSRRNIHEALTTLRYGVKPNKARSELAKALSAELQKRRETNQNGQEPMSDLAHDLGSSILAMSSTGDALHARDLLEQYWEECLKSWREPLWPVVLRGLILERRSDKLQETVDKMQALNVPFEPRMHQQIVVYTALKEENLELTKVLYKLPIASGKSPSNYADSTVLKLCIKNGELEWGERIFRSLLEKGVENIRVWETILQWAAAKGKSVDEIERMMQVMTSRSRKGGDNLYPDMDLINGLIWLANWNKDPYTAERYLALAQKWGLQPNARTYLLQIDYRLKVGDLGGARTAYARLRSEEVPDQEDLPVINKLVVALCDQQPPDYDAIMSLVEDLSERKVRFEADTVAALSALHLSRDEIDDLVDLLNTHAFHYGLEQRASIRDVLMKHCLDSSVPVSRAWETYNVLRQTFAETDNAIRTTIMNHFFKRGRSDMAVHVFGHMRQQQIKSLRPTASIYAQCLTGIGRAEDLELLQIVHNMVKLDTEIEPSTQLYNALILAYSGCGEPYRALRFWEDIVHSREGPSYASIQLVLRACEKAVSGDEVAREIWSKLQRFGIEVTREIYAAYVGALAGQHLFDDCVSLIDRAQQEIGYKPDALL